jgi:hypothetical protein
VLANFEEPGKIDLADYMEKNFMFNLPLEKFAYLTGRSLTTFKRDFSKISTLHLSVGLRKSDWNWHTIILLKRKRNQLTFTTKLVLKTYRTFPMLSKNILGMHRPT